MSNIRRARPYAREEVTEKRWRTQAVFYADTPCRPHRYRNECRVELLKWRTKPEACFYEDEVIPTPAKGQVDLFGGAA